jgi:dTDP-4-dehydrorhamnose 3,5-epimerase
MKGIEITPLKIIEGQEGSVLHALKRTEVSFTKFGEAYFSTVSQNCIKGWKKHTEMISHLIVPTGEVQFVFYDERRGSETYGCFFAINLSQKNYQRLTVQPGLWMAFKGIGREENTLLNIASICHNPAEAINDPIASSTKKFPL